MFIRYIYIRRKLNSSPIFFIDAVKIDETMLVTIPANLPEAALEFDMEFLSTEIELLCETDAWLALESTLTHALRLFVCGKCGESVSKREKYKCEGKCRLWFHTKCVKPDGRRKLLISSSTCAKIASSKT